MNDIFGHYKVEYKNAYPTKEGLSSIDDKIAEVIIKDKDNLELQLAKEQPNVTAFAVDGDIVSFSLYNILAKTHEVRVTYSKERGLISVRASYDAHHHIPIFPLLTDINVIGFAYINKGLYYYINSMLVPVPVDIDLEKNTLGYRLRYKGSLISAINKNIQDYVVVDTGAFLETNIKEMLLRPKKLIKGVTDV